MLCVGDIFYSKKYGKVVVIEYNGHSDVKVKFEDTGWEGTFFASSLRKGNFVDKSRLKGNSFKVGDEITTNKNIKITITNIKEDGSVEILFNDSGNIKCYKSIYPIIYGNIRDDIDLVGSRYISNNGKEFIILDYISYDEVTIKFIKSGKIIKSRMQNILKGQVREPLVQVGDIFPTTSCGDIEILEYYNKSNVLIKFKNTGSLKTVETKSIINGCIYDIESDIQGRGYRSEKRGYLYIHVYERGWAKIGITNNYTLRFKTLETNKLKPTSYKCFTHIDGNLIREIEKEILKSVELVKTSSLNEVSNLVSKGKNEIFYQRELDMVENIIKKYNLIELKVNKGKII